MRVIILYDSKFGNTEKVAYTIARTIENHCSVELCRASQVEQIHADLLIVGSPTHRRKPTPEIIDFINNLMDFGGIIAVFDTRYKMHWIKSGSAARWMAKMLRKQGYTVISVESFFVSGREGPLEEGELERARKWALGVMERLRSGKM